MDFIESLNLHTGQTDASITVKVKNRSRSALDFVLTEFEDTDTVADFMEIRLGLPADTTQLLFAGHVLDNDMTLVN